MGQTCHHRQQDGHYLLGRTESRSGEEERSRYVFSGCLSSRPTSGGLYIHDSEHPHLCRHAGLAKGGGWIYPEGEGTGEQIITSMTSHDV